MDISNTVPFEDESAKMIIVDLSFHYFDNKTTKDVIKEIKRILNFI